MKNYLSVMVVLVGAIALIVPSGYSYGFYGICFGALGLWMIRYRENLYSVDSRTFLIPLALFAIVHCGLALHEDLTLPPIGDYLPFLLIAFGFWAIRRFKVDENYFWLGLALGALAAGALATYQGVVLQVRAGAHMLAIQFGNAALLFAVLCLIRLICGGFSKKLGPLLLIGFISGLAASVFSQTRGGWVALLLIFSWVWLYATTRWRPKQRYIVAISMLVLFGALSSKSDSIVRQRVESAYSEFIEYFEYGRQDTAVGTRLAMWRVGLMGLKEAPFVGHGNAGWLKNRDDAITTGELSSFSSDFGHLHNEFLNVAYKRGLVGLAFLLAMYLVPMLYFFKPYLNHDNPEVRALAMAGMVIPMMYMDFGLTQSFLTHNSGRVVLCSLWMCVAALMLNAAEGHEVQT